MNALVLALLLSTALTADPSGIAIDTTDMKPGQAHVFSLDGGIKITVTRYGEQRRVLAERDGIVNSFTIAPATDGELRVVDADTSAGNVLGTRGIVVDGVLIGAQDRRGRSRFYICPKDETMVRVGDPKFIGELKCPVDGTPMKSGLGRQSSIFLLQ